MDFVWIYIDSPSYFYKTGIFNELDYSIRSVRKNYQGESRCIVVGDDPGLDVIHLPVDRIETCKRGYFRHFDMIKKLKTYLDWTDSDEFVLMYDDIYLLQPVFRENLMEIYAKERILDLNEYLKTRKGDMSYIRCWESTMNRIAEFRDDLWDFETHLPRYYDTELLERVMDDFRLEKVAYLVYSIYASLYCGTPMLVTDDIQSHVLQDRPLMNDYDSDFSARFMNVSDDGISQDFRHRMEKLFS